MLDRTINTRLQGKYTIAFSRVNGQPHSDGGLTWTVLEAVFDSKFRPHDGDSSANEDRDSAYACRD